MGSGFESQTKAPQITYATEGVQPPTALAVTTNDNLVIKVHNSNAAPGLRVFVRLLLPDGTISPNDFTVTPDATRAVNTFSFPLDEGFILSAVVFSTSATLLRGQCYVRLLIFRGSLTQQFVGHMLCEGYVTTATSIAFPVGPQEYARSGAGVMRSITGATPAAGTDIVETVPTGAVWRLSAFTARLGTDATVPSRQPILLITDGTSTLAGGGPGAGIGASNTQTFTWTEYGQSVAARNNWLFGNVPVMHYLSPGYTIQTTTSNLVAGDQWSLVRYLVEEWIQP